MTHDTTMEEEEEELVKKFLKSDAIIKDGVITVGLGNFTDFIRNLIARTSAQSTCDERIKQAVREREVTEDTSDGYHTFKELYEFRKLYNACLFNEWAKQGRYNVHKSQRHSDGELCFGRTDYFIVVASLPTGQISNHYPMSDWELFKCKAVEQAEEKWDGHSSQDVAKRLESLLAPETLPTNKE